LRPLFAKPLAWRILDAFIAVVMCAIGLSLLWSFAQQAFGLAS
jgi:L-lysine exporter family protein LysE/ArgO